MLNREELNELVKKTGEVIKNMDSVGIGRFFDELYGLVEKDFSLYQDILVMATMEIEEGMTEEEIEIQDEKMIQAPSWIGRPRSYHELTYEECETVMDMRSDKEKQTEFRKTITR